MTSWTVATYAEQPETRADFRRLNAVSWPRFLRERDELGVNEVWSSLHTEFAEFQFLLRDDAGAIVAAGQTVPFAWDGTADDLPETMGGLIQRALTERHAARRPTALSALAALVDPRQRAQGLSAAILRTMRSLAARHGLGELVAPVRPTLKASYPLARMDRYITWRRADRMLVDPWMRVHERLGAVVVRIAPCTIRVVGTVAEWEEWTSMAFPESGPYVVPGALQPVLIDREKDDGRYEDPNVWMRHPPLDGDAR